MVEIHRHGVTEPKGWKKKVARALGDAKAFDRKARAFERLALDHPKRLPGFPAYAGRAMLPEGDFPAVWRRAKALKAALYAMTEGHCAYCQKAIERATVEHVRPKSLFPTLAYCVDNYLPTCTECNEAKSNRWPAEGAYVRPDAGDPAPRFVFGAHGEMWAAPGDEEAHATIWDIGLDRAALRKMRRVRIEQAMKTLRPILEALGVPEAVRVAHVKRYLVSQLSPFSEAMNQSVRRAWGLAFPRLPL